MIEIITDNVPMPDIEDRRFQKSADDINGGKWKVVDTTQNNIIYIGKFEDASLICHNLNKKNYQ